MTRGPQPEGALAMPAYVVSRVRIFNAEAMAEYLKEVPPIVHAFGGKYLMRGTDVEALEGTWEHERMVILEFPTRDAALAWYHSAEYAPLKAQRQASSDAVILLANPPP
jgi:uncharacterized protein (DUF1330 family)